MSGTIKHFDEIDDGCSNCDGSGWVESCFEDCCVCVDPPCTWARCDYCNHDGRVSKRPPE